MRFLIKISGSKLFVYNNDKDRIYLISPINNKTFKAYMTSISQSVGGLATNTGGSKEGKTFETVWWSWSWLLDVGWWSFLLSWPFLTSVYILLLSGRYIDEFCRIHSWYIFIQQSKPKKYLLARRYILHANIIII